MQDFNRVSSDSLQHGAHLVFIDPAVAEAAMLARGVEPGYTAIVLDAGRDGVRQIAHHLARYRDVAAVHIVAHGGPGEITLGAARLSSRSLEEHGHVLEIWRDALDLDAELHLWCCETAAGPAGAAFLRELADLLGVSIAAARGKIGAAWLGGGWMLDARIGDIVPVLPFRPAAVERVASVFATASELLTLGTDGAKANATFTFGTQLSEDGRFVLFASDASNLVAGDTNGVTDVFVHDRQTDTTERVSVTAAGAQVANGGTLPSISGDGRFIAFTTISTELVPGNGGAANIVVKDRIGGGVELISFTATGAPAGQVFDTPTAAISADGLFVAFDSFSSDIAPGDQGGRDIFVTDRNSDTAQRISRGVGGVEPDGSSQSPSISGNGRFVAYESVASNLVAGDSNGFRDIFVFDRQTNATTRVSVASNGTQGNDDSFNAVISADGRFVAFSSEASNLVAGDVATDSGGFRDVFVHDRLTGATERVSVSSQGVGGNGDSFLNGPGAISADGRFVTFISSASNLVVGDLNGVADAFIYDRETNSIERVTRSDNTEIATGSDTAAISGDGRTVAFVTDTNNLFPGDTLTGNDQVYVATVVPQVSLSIAPAQVNEGNAGGATLSFMISLSDSSPAPVTVAVATSDGTAKAGSDYTPFSGTVTIPAGETTATVTVPITGDSVIEIDESLFVTLTNPSVSAVIDAEAATARGTILNDDQAAFPTINGQTINGTGGNDFLVGSALNDSIVGQAGNDTEFGNEQSDVLIGGEGDDFIVADFPADFAFGSADVVDAGPGNDNVFAGGGNDTLIGGAGNDLLAGDSGNNLIFGGAGDNALFGFDGADTIQGGNDGDIVFGLSGPDVIATFGGIDLIIAGGDNDGAADADLIDAGDGNTILFAGSGNDTIFSGNGDDFLLGESGNDAITSGAGNDALIAGPGNDTLDGGTGDDILIPEGGDDTMRGRAGADTFRYPTGIAVNADRIVDYAPGIDHVELAASLGFATPAQALAGLSAFGPDSTLTFPGGIGTIVFAGVGVGALTEADFVIV